jgi:DNA-binding response OmpR family regulator
VPTTRDPRQVLLVDDDRLIRLLARKALEAVGCRVVEAATAESGVSLAKADPPDLILLDFHLPDQDAPAVARELRAFPALATTRILLLSGSQEPDDIAAALAAGVDDHLAKPFTPGALAARVRLELDRLV